MISPASAISNPPERATNRLTSHQLESTFITTTFVTFLYNTTPSATAIVIVSEDQPFAMIAAEIHGKVAEHEVM